MRQLILSLLLIAIGPSGMIVAAEPEARPSIRLAADQHDYFTDSDCVVPIRIELAAKENVSVAWRVQIEKRTWKSGTHQALKPTVEHDLAIQFRSPKPRPGVELTALLEIEASTNNNNNNNTTASFELVFFPADPFLLDRQFAQRIGLSLLGSAKALQKCLKSIDFPYRTLTLPHTEPPQGLLMITAEDDLTESHGRLIGRWQAAGQPVWLLDSCEGQWLVARDEDWKSSDIHLTSNAYLLNELPKHITAANCSSQRSGALIKHKGQYIVRVTGATSETNGWQALAVRDLSTIDSSPKVSSRLRLAYTSLDLVTSWNDRPTARYLLRGMLEQFIDSEKPLLKKDAP